MPDSTGPESVGAAFSRAVRRMNNAREELALAKAEMEGCILTAQIQFGYCGCCGREIIQGTSDWCMDCLQAHIDTTQPHKEDQLNTDCEFRVA